MLAYHQSPPARKDKARLSSIHEATRAGEVAQANNIINGETVVTQPEVAADFSLVVPDYVNLAWEYWLKTLYQLTGQWWLPPAPAPAFPDAQSANNTQTARLRNKPPDISLLKPVEDFKVEKSQAKNFVKVVKENVERFEYGGSVYFRAARELLSQWESPLAEQCHTGAEMDGESPLAEQCPTSSRASGQLARATQVLAFIVAWCHNPIFSGPIGKEEIQEQAVGKVHWRSNVSQVGGWMMLSRQRCAREVGMRPEAFIESCEWLENMGILETGDSSSGIIAPEIYEQFLLNLKAAANQPEVKEYWPARALQNKTTIYRIKVRLPEEFELPPFSLSLNTEKDWERVSASKLVAVNQDGGYAEISRAQPPPTAAIREDEEKPTTQFSAVTERQHIHRKGKVGSGKASERVRKDETSLGKGSEEWSGKAFSEVVSSKEVKESTERLRKAFPKSVSSERINQVEITENAESFPKPFLTEKMPFPVENLENLHDHGYVKYNVLESESNQIQIHDKSHVSPNLVNLVSEMKSEDEKRANSLEPLVEAKLSFLKQEARFEGFSGAKGRVTLDYGPALKLATNPAISLEDLRGVYNQVQRRWLNGELKNPVGYFYNSLKNLGLKNNSVQVNPKLLWDRASAHDLSLAAGNRERKLDPTELDDTEIDNLDGVEAQLAPPVVGYGNNTGWEQIMQDSQVVTDLWERVRTEDLPGRFRLSSTQLKLLEGSKLLVDKSVYNSADTPGVVVKLRSALELSELGYEARNLIRMALTQRAGSGYALIFEG